MEVLSYQELIVIKNMENMEKWSNWIQIMKYLQYNIGYHIQ